LRRAIPSFTVEVRRRPRLVTNTSQSLQSSETKILWTGVERESLTVAATALEPERSNQVPIDAVVSCAKGRILRSLVPEEPNASLSASTLDPISRARKRPQARVPKPSDQTSCQSHGAPQDEGTGVSSSEPAAPPSRVAGNGSRLALRSKAKRREKKPTTLDDSRVAPSFEDQRYMTRTDSPPIPLPSVDETSSESRRRVIMGRYVFGDELKPGERWKRRFRT
jgi:hypothetical protein